jgi:hypothetical protein
MIVWIDPERNETDALFDLVELEGREVPGIGCGDGRARGATPTVPRT